MILQLNNGKVLLRIISTAMSLVSCRSRSALGIWSENKERTGDGMKNLMDIYTRKKKDIAAIEKELEESVYTDHAMLRETSMHLLKAGGKRISPVFVLLSGEFGSYQLQTMKHVAVPLGAYSYGITCS